MAFIQDPRLRQTWNQLSHTTEAVTSDAAAGIWTFGHRYVNPCLASLGSAVDACAGVCLGGRREERARRARERDRGARRAGTRTRAEYSFDFYDDWEEDFAADEFGSASAAGGLEGAGEGSGGGGILGGDWDRLLAGTGSVAGYRGRHGAAGAGAGGDVVDQPRRKRGMSYGTRGVRRKVSGEEEDPNVIPRTAPLGFLARLPFKIVGSLRYKPSAANLREHPGSMAPVQGHHGDEGGGVEDHEREPLLGASDEVGRARQGKRPRSDTTTSGDTSSSYRSRGDLFPSDGEGDEDAVPLDDEFTVALERVDDRGSTKTRSSKGKRPADRDRDRDRDKALSRTVSRTTISSTNTPYESREDLVPLSPREAEEVARVPSLEDLRREEEQAAREEHEEIERRRKAASHLATKRGLSTDDFDAAEDWGETKDSSLDRERLCPSAEEVLPEEHVTTIDSEEVDGQGPPHVPPPEPFTAPTKKTNGQPRSEGTFVPARLPHFG